MVRCLFVCLPVRLSVTFVYSVETNKHIMKLFSPSGDKCSVSTPHVMTTFRREPHPWEHRMKVGLAKIAILRQYLAPSRAVNNPTAKCNTQLRRIVEN